MPTAPLWTEASLAGLRGVAEAAGLAILSVYGRADFGVQRKADLSPLTEADTLADRLILARLALMFPGTPVVSEETPAPPGTDLSGGYFLVDPLDGTKEFIARNGEFTVNIAWVEGGRPRAGVVHAPALGQTHWGALGVGAWSCDAQGREQAIRTANSGPNTESFTGSVAHRGANPQARAPLRVLASRSHGGAAQEAFLRAAARWAASQQRALQVLTAGSSLKFCRIAEGAADLYPRLSPTAPWDTAAGQAVLEAAGGVVLRLEDGQPLGVPDRPFGALNPDFLGASNSNWAAVAAQFRNQNM